MLALAAVFLASASTTSHAFAFTPTFTVAQTPTPATSKTSSDSTLFSSLSFSLSATPEAEAEAEAEGTTKPDLVDLTLFKAAVDRVNDEIEAQYKAQKIAEGTATEEPSAEEAQWLAEQARAKQDEREQKYIYLVGKLDVSLPIDTQPELDLTEAMGMVLVTSVWGRTAEATGMQEFDTLTKVGVNDPNQPFAAKTKCASLEETAGALTAAAQHAIALGKTEIQLEVQRLIKGFYAPE